MLTWEERVTGRCPEGDVPTSVARCVKHLDLGIAERKAVPVAHLLVYPWNATL